MYWRMLKKDLKDRVGLNIVLCIFMIISATLMVMSAGFLYTMFAGINKTYEKCNTSDIFFCVPQSVSDREDQRKTITELLRSDPYVGEIDISERVQLPTSRIEFEGVDKRSTTSLYDNVFLISPVSRGQNIPYDLNDQQFTVQDGCVGIPQALAYYSKTKAGDTIRLTTDLGNIYEFTVSHIYKDPSGAQLYRMLFSDDDYERLLTEYFGRTDLYELKLKEDFATMPEFMNWGIGIGNRLRSLGPDGKIEGGIDIYYTGKTNMLTNAAVVSLIISIFMVIMGISLILLIITSIRFSLRATIKREEREIGMMKAIGVDSLSYRSLFIVKYIAFAVIGGIFGSVAGTALCRLMIRNIIYNTLNPDSSFLILLGLGVSLFFILLMIAFSFIALRRMRKISVMDTIHGENRGERFKKLPGVFLHKSRRMSVPFFLAVGDIMGRLKRYRYLIISYMLGMVVFLMVLQLKETLVSDNFRRTYWCIGDREVMIRPEEELRDRLIDREGSYQNVFLYYERYYGEQGIPLDYQIVDEQDVSLINGEERDSVYLYFGDYEPERLKLVRGGKAPQLPNEAVVSHSLKLYKGIEIGDTITLEYRVYGEDGFSVETVQRDFIVTGYVENMQTCRVYIGQNGDDILAEDWDIFNVSIGGDESEYDDHIRKMRELNEDIQIWDYDQVLEYDLGSQFGPVLNLLLLATAIILTVTNLAMTFLYQQIFVEEETTDIAMLKSLGVDKGSICGWHYIRMLILVVFASVAATLVSFTLARIIFGEIGKAVLHVAEFNTAPAPLSALILLPLAVALMITAVLTVSFKEMDRIRIWRIRNE